MTTTLHERAGDLAIGFAGIRHLVVPMSTHQILASTLATGG